MDTWTKTILQNRRIPMQSQIVFLKSGANFLTLYSLLLGEAVVLLEVVFLFDATNYITYSILILSGYTQLVERAGSILQMNEALDVRLKFLAAIVEYKLNISDPDNTNFWHVCPRSSRRQSGSRTHPCTSTIAVLYSDRAPATVPLRSITYRPTSTTCVAQQYNDKNEVPTHWK